MAHGLYLYKNIGDIRLEIHRKDWTGNAIEIKAMGVTPIELIGLDSAESDVLTPIVKSSVNIDIKDLGEVNYRELFTSDATKFKVIIKDKGVQVWGGYLTPDSYSQTYEYRTSIKLVARDNLGMLDQLDYDWFEVGFITPAEFVVKVQEKISWAMSPVMWYAQKLKSEDGTNVNDAHINTELFRETTWWEALSVVLSSLGQQMRYVGNNKVFICNVADLHQLGVFGLSGNITHSIGSAAQMEIVPSWRELEVKQNYGVLKNAFKDFPKTSSEFIYSKTLSIMGFCPEIKSDYFDWSENSVNIPLYTLNKWNLSNPTSESRILLANPYQFPIKKEDKGMYIANKNALRENDNQDYISRFIKIPKIEGGGVKFEFEVANRFYTPYFQYDWSEDINWIDPIFKSLLPDVANNFAYQLDWTFQLLYRYIGEDGLVKTLILKENWDEYENNKNFLISFKVDAPITDKIGTSKVSIIAETIPYDGELELRVFRWRYIEQEGVRLKYPYNQFARIVDISMQLFPLEINEVDILGVVNEQGNVKESVDIAIGEVPVNSGDYLAYAGGLFDGSVYHKALTGWHRSDDKGGVRPLAELIGRGYAHHFAAFRNINNERTGGEIITANISFVGTQDFAKRFTVRDKEFILISGSYDIVHRQANVTLRQVLPYEHQEGEFKANAISGGGDSVIGGGGNNSVVVWGTEGGGVNSIKRVYDLPIKTDLSDAFILVDKQGDSEASKVPVSLLSLKAHTHSDYALKNGSLQEPFRVNSLEVALSGGGSAIVAYDLANPSYTPPTGGGTLDLHASTHGKGGVDPITPIMIGAAAEVHSHTGYANATHDHNAVYSLLNHNHNAVYSLLSHSHTDYSLTNHNHDSVYTPIGHATNKSNPHGVTAGQIGAYAEYAGNIQSANIYTFTNRPSGGYTVQYSGQSGALHVLRSGGSTSAIELFMSDHNFGTRLKLRKTIDSNRYDGGFKELAWLSDLDNYALKNGSLAEYFAVKTLRMSMGGSYAEVSYNANSSSYTPPTGGGDGTLDHSLLLNRNNSDQHTIAAITGLQSALNGKQPIGSYAAMTHDHNAVYSLLNHNHNAAYSLLSHSHTAAQVGAIINPNNRIQAFADDNETGLEFTDVNGGKGYVGKTNSFTYLFNNGKYLKVCNDGVLRIGEGWSQDGAVLYHSENLPTPSTAPTANTLAQRDAAGYLEARIFRDTFNIEDTLPIGAVGFKLSQADGYHRFCTVDYFKSQLNLMTRIGTQYVSQDFKVQTQFGYLKAYPIMDEWCHFATDRPKYYFNKPVFVAGDVYGGVDYNRRFAYVDEINVGGRWSDASRYRFSGAILDDRVNGGMYVSFAPGSFDSTTSMYFYVSGWGTGEIYWNNSIDANKWQGANKRMWHDHNSNLPTVDWTMKNASIAGNAIINGNIQYKQAVAALYNNAGVETGTITIKYIQ